MILVTTLGGMPDGARIVMGSSSVWKDLFFQLRDAMGFDVTLSNPYTTKLIAESKKKTDKVDACTLADMHRGGYIAECHIPSKERMEGRDLVRYRRALVDARTTMKNFVHGILLQRRMGITGTPFSGPWRAQAAKINDCRIDENLRLIDSINDTITRLDVRVCDMADGDPDTVLLQSIPGVGRYSALTIASEIDGADRFAGQTGCAPMPGSSRKSGSPANRPAMGA